MVPVILSAVLLASPIAFGAVHAPVYRLVQFVVFFTLFLQGISQIFSLRPKPFRLQRPFLIPLTFWILWGILQTIPMPQGIVRILSPEAFQIQQIILWPEGPYLLSLAAFDTWQALLQVLACAALFYLSAGSSSWRLPFFAVIAAAGFEAFYGMTSYLSESMEVLMFHRLSPLSGAAGTYVNPNHYANYLILSFPLAFSWAASLASRPLRIFSMLIPGALAAAVVFSHSRMAVFILTLQILFLIPRAFPQSKRGALLLWLFFAGAIAGASAFDPGLSSFGKELGDLFAGRDNGRLVFWQDCLRIIRDFPLAGTGLGTFQWIYPKYASETMEARLTHAHNDWLELGVETGVVGVLLIFAAGILFFNSYRKFLSRCPEKTKFPAFALLISLLGFLTHGLADFNFHIPANAYTFSVILGMAVRLIGSGVEEEK